MSSRTKLILNLVKHQVTEQNDSAQNKENGLQTEEHSKTTSALERTHDWVKTNNFISMKESISSPKMFELKDPINDVYEFTSEKGNSDDHFNPTLLSITEENIVFNHNDEKRVNGSPKMFELKYPINDVYEFNSERGNSDDVFNATVIPINDESIVLNNKNEKSVSGSPKMFELKNLNLKLKDQINDIYEFTVEEDNTNKDISSDVDELGIKLYRKYQHSETINDIYYVGQNPIEDYKNFTSSYKELKSNEYDNIYSQETEQHAITSKTKEILDNGHENFSDKSSITVNDDDRDKDFNIDDYSSSSDSETLSDKEKDHVVEADTIPKIKVHEIQILKNNLLTQFDKKQTVVIGNTETKYETITKNTNQLTIGERIQRQIKSTKKETRCKFCNKDLISKNFVRHMETYHRDENELKKILILPKKSKQRREAFGLLRNDTNFQLFLTGEVRPSRKPEELEPKSIFYPCVYCKGLFKKEYLKRHSVFCRNKQSIKDDKVKNYVSDSQTFTACAIDPTDVISKLNVRDQVFTIMKGDQIAFEAKKDLLIVHFGESYLKQHKRERKEYTCSNRMRELSRLLIAFREITQNNTISLKEILVPKNVDNILAATRLISGYDAINKVFSAPSLAMHMGTYLKVVCDELNHLVLKESPGFTCRSKEETQNWQQDIKNLKELLTTRWNTEIASVANKDMQEKRWNKPLLVPLVSDIKIFRDGVLKLANECEKTFHDYEDNVETYKLLTNCTLSLLILFNRRRIGDVQYLKIKDYSKTTSSNFDDFEHALTDSEKALTQRYKRVLNSGKGSRAVVILVPEELQKFIDTLLRFRKKYISDKNEYVFALPHSKIKWGQGDVAIRNLAKKFDLQKPDAITSNKLRKHIATVTQILNLSKEDSKQFSKFMGHTEKTHAEFYELPIDIYQTAKVSKLLLMMEKGKLPVEYKGKSLDEIEIDMEFPEENHDNLDSSKNMSTEDSFTRTDNVNVEDSDARPKWSEINVSTPITNKRRIAQTQGSANIDMLETSQQDDSDDAKLKGSKRSKVQKRGWSENEVDLLRSTFEYNIKNEIYPTSKAIRDFTAKNGINRSAPVIKAKIQHLIKLRK